VHNDQPKLNLRCKRKALSALEDLLEIVGLEVTVEGVRAGTHSDGCSWPLYANVTFSKLELHNLL